MTVEEKAVVYGTEDVLVSLCNSVTRVLNVATQSKINYSAMVQRITKTCLKPDIGCFVLFDGGFSGLVVINFSAQAAMERYGVHSAGSTALAGNVEETVALEAELGALLRMPEVLLFPTGWAAGFGAIKGLVRETDHIVIDQLAHNCLHEGARAATIGIRANCSGVE